MMKGSSAMVKEFLAAKSKSQQDLADLLKMEGPNLNKKLRKKDISVDLITQISVALNHNFFYDLALESGIKFVTKDMPRLSIEDIIRETVRDEINSLVRPFPKLYIRNQEAPQLNEPEQSKDKKG